MLLRGTAKFVSEPILKTVYISFGANRLNAIPNHSISFRIRIHSVCIEFTLIKSDWFSSNLYWTRFRMFSVLVRNDPGESFGLEFNSYESNLFRNLFANHSELFWTNKKSALNLVWCEFIKNQLESFQTPIHSIWFGLITRFEFIRIVLNPFISNENQNIYVLIRNDSGESFKLGFNQSEYFSDWIEVVSANVSD